MIQFRRNTEPINRVTGGSLAFSFISFDLSLTSIVSFKDLEDLFIFGNGVCFNMHSLLSRTADSIYFMFHNSAMDFQYFLFNFVTPRNLRRINVVT